MTEASDSALPTGELNSAPAPTAGAMLRAARQAQGLHVAALATMLKVAPRKLEALENDRHEELQGITFVRALAQAACRALKLDPAPVLARLPRPDPHTLGPVSAGLNAPFRERGMKRDAPEGLLGNRWLLWVVLALCVAAVALWWLPRDLISQFSELLRRTAPVASTTPGDAGSFPAATAAGPDSATPVATGTDVPAARPAASSNEAGGNSSAMSGDIAARPAEVAQAGRSGATAVGAAPLAPISADASAGLAPSAAVTAGRATVQLRTREASWIEVTDANSQVLLARVVAAGEDLTLAAAAPMRVKIGNARATELLLRGQSVDLQPQTRDNVARLELK